MEAATNPTFSQKEREDQDGELQASVPPELPRLYKTLNVLHLVCTTSHLYNTSFVQNLDIQHLICTKLIFTTPLLYNTLDTQHSDIQHLNLQF